jgi:hypothetical protein
MAHFVSKGLQRYYNNSGGSVSIVASNIVGKTGWRLMAWCSLVYHTTTIFLPGWPVAWPFLLIWALSRLISKGLYIICGIGNGNFASFQGVRAWTLVGPSCCFDSLLRLTYCLQEHIARLFMANHPQIFWAEYFFFTGDKAAFISDYCTAWRMQGIMDSEISVYIDNVQYLTIPCSLAADDGQLIEHLRMFYDLYRALGGLLELFSAKSCQRIDIVQVNL